MPEQTDSKTVEIEQSNEAVTRQLDTIIDGLDSQDVWILVRRFNQQIFHLKKATQLPRGALDLNIAEDEEFSPNKLRAQFERLYIGIIIGIVGTMKHIARLRSWNEPRRTAVFCVIYFAACIFDSMGSLLVIFSASLILSSSTRKILFPPAPLSLVNYSTGDLAHPSAGVLGSTDSATGAPEAHRGRALENEANNFITGIAVIATNVLIQKDTEDESNSEDDVSIPGPNKIATKVVVIKDKALGINKPSQDKTKFPMEKAMWSKVRPIMHSLCLISDFWERCGNLISPTPPFNQDLYRIRLLKLFIPLLVASRLVTAHVFFKSSFFIIGVTFFGKPLQAIISNYLDENFPDWRKYMQLNSTLLKGVPTNIQLTVTLLRQGESNNNPLPPPPETPESSSQEPIELSKDVLDAVGDDQPLNATKDELNEAIRHHPDKVSEAGGPDVESSKSTKHGKSTTKVLDVVKGSAKAAASTVIGLNRIVAKTGSEAAKARVGVVPEREDRSVAGPSKFAARWQGELGHVEIITEAMSPCIAFVHDSKKKLVGLETAKMPDSHWTVPVTELAELKKSPGYGFKSKLMMGWALDKKISDSMEIVDVHGVSRVLTALPQRDALFNRLCAMGDQKWESW